MSSLWGEEFEIPKTENITKKIISKIQKPKTVVKTTSRTISKLSTQEKLKIIIEEVNNKLGRFKNDTLVIRDRQVLHDYISKAIDNKIIAIDTETNNSLDPITCKLMGPCIYTPGQKNVYIPINHVNPDTLELLPNQLTEQDIKEEFSRLNDTFVVMHNGKFDYEVIKCTCNIEVPINWDTMIGARILDENERSSGLKQQYIDKIDPSIEKYSIDELFEDIQYSIVPPEIFALYAATDPYMTFKLYEYQKKIFELPENKNLYSLFLKVEMPVVPVVANMELTGISFDQEYAKRLSEKWHKKLDVLDAEAAEEIKKLQPKIDAWRLSPEANAIQKTREGNEGKTKNEQLEDPIKLSSPSQLAILLYDVLKIKPVSKKSPRGTGSDILEKLDIPICKIILERRGVSKLIESFIDSLPEEVNSKTGKIHCHFNQLGAATGRFSCSEPNLQQIPSHEKSIRMLFKASDVYEDLPIRNNTCIFSIYDEVETPRGWVPVTSVKVGDSLISTQGVEKVINIESLDKKITLTLEREINDSI